MFTDEFYPVFDKNYKSGFVVFYEGSVIYGNELNKILKKIYRKSSLTDCTKDFVSDVNAAFREYAKVRHIKIRYDSFTENMKTFLDNENYTLCEIQNMTRKEIFTLFEGSSMDFLYEVASNLFTYDTNDDDSHEESFR